MDIQNGRFMKNLESRFMKDLADWLAKYGREEISLPEIYWHMDCVDGIIQIYANTPAKFDGNLKLVNECTRIDLSRVN